VTVPERDAQDARRGAARDAADRFQRLVEIMQTLRSADGCPWDREQTFESLTPFVLEEAYEVVEAIERGDDMTLVGEIGDMIFEGVFLAQIGADEGRFSIGDALQSISEKLVRRHPHVFKDTGQGDTPPPANELDAAGVVEQWEKLKERERRKSGDEGTVLGGIPRTLPALLRAHEIGTRVAAVGFDWASAPDVLAKIDEEVAEFRRAVEHEGRARSEEEMGDLLFSIANLARKLGIEPEAALRKANDKFTRRFTNAEARLRARGVAIHDAGLPALEEAWNAVKDAN
jgi:MazG family protein